MSPDSSGRSVKRVVVERRGAEEAYSADVVVVSCGAVNSAALLFGSVSDRHPNGLANSSDVIARHYGAPELGGDRDLRTRNDTKFQKTLGLNDYYWGAGDSQLPLGHIQMLGKSDADILRTGAPRFVPGLALDYVANVRWTSGSPPRTSPAPTTASRSIAEGTSTSPRAYNADRTALLAKLGPARSAGLPPNARIPRWSVLSQQIPLAGIAHNCGTVRFGADPGRSALDLNCKAHDLDNLYVVDASFFPSSSAGNPDCRSPTRCASATTFSAAQRTLDRQRQDQRMRVVGRPDSPAARDRAGGRRAVTPQGRRPSAGRDRRLLPARLSHAGHDVRRLAESEHDRARP